MLKLATRHSQRAVEVNEKVADIPEQGMPFVKTLYEMSGLFKYYEGIGAQCNPFKRSGHCMYHLL
jgi:hypothetical protein